MSQELRHSIHRYFAEIGPEGCEAVYQELIKPGGLIRLLKKLNLSTEGNVAAQYASLIRYFRKNGNEPFYEMIRSRPEPKSPAAPAPPLSGRRPEQKGIHPSIAGGGVRPTIPSAPTAHQEPPKPNPPQQTIIPASPSSGALKPGAPPAPGTFGPETPSWDPSKPHDPNGQWPNVERRSGRERRKKVRRENVELVFNNRRYGRDRRSGEERRRSWPKKGHQD